ncbi:TetR/AcrR family transcriptional regulator [Streptomyces clavifer]|uniref:TetR/AcrR family transcriptional regulator n=1 Tax=Streptomyces clavifer TaxID=68188 RepID=UPI0038B610AC
MQSIPTTRAAGPSRLSEERRCIIFTAVREVLKDVGFAALTMDMVSAKARTSKAGLYRRWQHKTQLVAAALEQSERIRIDTVDTGTLAGDQEEVAVKAGEDGGHRPSTLLDNARDTRRQTPRGSTAQKRRRWAPSDLSQRFAGSSWRPCRGFRRRSWSR